MAGLNKIQIIGHLGGDPEMRFTQNGVAVTSFSVAVTRKWNGKDGGRDEETIWFRVSAWNKLAEICNEYLTKGKQVYIEGRMRSPNVFTDKNGNTRASLELTATDMLMLGSRGGNADVEDGYSERDTESDERAVANFQRNKPVRLRPVSPTEEDEIPY